MMKLLTLFILAALIIGSHQKKKSHSSRKCWTKWFNSDRPSKGGDFETLATLRKKFPGAICKKPLKIEVQTRGGLCAALTDDVFFKKDVITGFICRNRDQRHERRCRDYRVRFLCPTSFCQRKVCWTKFFDRDNPSGKGDWELLKDLRKKHPGQICHRPFLIEAATVKGKVIPAGATGQHFFIYSPTKGFVCRNKDQKGRKCLDFKVRFGCPVSFCRGGCWTSWLDRDNPSGKGDFETLIDLLKEKPGKVCSHPRAIEGQTLSGVHVSAAGNAIHRFSPKTGLICLNSAQPKGKSCKDYRVRFLCPPIFCGGGCWTPWYDRDNPSAKGDFETLADLRKENPGQDICKKPLALEVTTTTGVKLSAAGNVIKTFSPKTGFVCLNKDQPKGVTCKDFRVRFLCPPSHCKGVCWTKFLDRDNPSGTGDWELLKDLRKKHPKQICKHPLFIQVFTSRGKMVPAGRTKQRFFIFSPTKGFVCRNKDQRKGKCLDYKVRFGCPCKK